MLHCSSADAASSAAVMQLADARLAAQVSMLTACAPYVAKAHPMGELRRTPKSELPLAVAITQVLRTAACVLCTSSVHILGGADVVCLPACFLLCMHT